MVWLLARERPDAAEGAYSKRLLVGLVRISLGYLVLFGAGMGLILANRGLGSARLGQAMGDLSDMLTVGVLGQYLLINFSLCGVLVAPVVIVALSQSRSRPAIFALGLALAPMLAIQGIAGIIYLDAMHGMTWPPRFVLIWTVGLAAILITAARPQPPAAIKVKRWTTVAAASFLFCYQVVALWAVRGYPAWERMATVSTEGLLLDRLTGEEISFLDCLAADLPKQTYVAGSGEVFGKFHRHPIVWPNRTESAWRPPEIVLCDEGRRLGSSYFHYDCDALLKSTIEEGSKEATVGDFRISYTAQVESPVGACLAPHGASG